MEIKEIGKCPHNDDITAHHLQLVDTETDPSYKTLVFVCVPHGVVFTTKVEI